MYIYIYIPPMYFTLPLIPHPAPHTSTKKTKLMDQDLDT